MTRLARAAIRDVESGRGIEAGGRENDRRAIGAERPGEVVVGMVGEPPGGSPGARNDENIMIAMAIRSEGDLLAVRRPKRVEFAGDMLGQLSGFATGGRDGVKVSAVSEDDGLSVGRESRVAEPLCRPGRERKSGEKNDHRSHGRKTG